MKMVVAGGCTRILRPIFQDIEGGVDVSTSHQGFPGAGKAKTWGFHPIVVPDLNP
jgi:hypothetical protein